MNGRRAFVVAIGAQLAFAGSIMYVGAVSGVHGTASASPNEDQQWSCVDDGNRICGPGNSNGAPAGCYDDGGVLVAVWPCSWHTLDNGQRLLIASDGSADLYYPAS